MDYEIYEADVEVTYNMVVRVRAKSKREAEAVIDIAARDAVVDMLGEESVSILSCCKSTEDLDRYDFDQERENEDDVKQALEKLRRQ